MNQRLILGLSVTTAAASGTAAVHPQPRAGTVPIHDAMDGVHHGDGASGDAAITKLLQIAFQTLRPNQNPHWLLLKPLTRFTKPVP